jgi:23S rRNA pseudouridine1911/1915/1917 synthase
MSTLKNKLPVIFEDADILVIDKPFGVIVNNSRTTESAQVETMQDMINDNIDFSDSDEESEFYLRGGIVHRLDKETSGLLIVAKNETSFANLQKQFKDREVHKVYLALVLGGFKEKVLEIDAPIIRNPNNRTKFSLSKDGKPAFTRVEFVESYTKEDEVISLVSVFPLTGRTHQSSAL